MVWVWQFSLKTVKVIYFVWENPTACGGDESDFKSAEGWRICSSSL